ncbi:3'-5' exonuclease [Amycolatopsis acidicola]|uniref:3'-5' exonuclease n=1 Tax=Amycolatopsis acidicola TaxID=2596893 RepID=A0A5N0UX48_9PSEU|nr:3'-5' exonuclease [Amycolatopsis acidicola]KAA9157948.1 3'-5' exonuclease [Amycolatopsis acidicola]
MNSSTKPGSMTTNHPAPANGALVPDHTAPWTDAHLVAIDLEGSGPKDPAGEAILEIALVPLRNGTPDLESAFTTLINPGRAITRGPWTSPGITNAVLRDAPTLGDVAPTIIDKVAGATLVGHNVRVDWRLLHAVIPDAAPAGLIDTLRLAKHRHPELAKGHGLQAWIDRLHLTSNIDQTAPGSQPHRALWDTIATAMLLQTFMRDTTPADATFGTLGAAAGLDLNGKPFPAPQPDNQQGLWDK